MKLEIVKDEPALAIARQYDLVEMMLAEASGKRAEAEKFQVGMTICAKRAWALESGFLFLFVTYCFGFISERENGWACVKISEIAWDELPEAAEKLLQAEECLKIATRSTEATKLYEQRKASA